MIIWLNFTQIKNYQEFYGDYDKKMESYYNGVARFHLIFLRCQGDSHYKKSHSVKRKYVWELVSGQGSCVLSE